MGRDEILERIVALHDERVKEAAAGHVRWLRPDYQIPRFGGDSAPGTRSRVGGPGREGPHASEPHASRAAEPGAESRAVWPTSAIDQIAALKALASAAPGTADEIAARFAGARRDLVARHLETLGIMGELRAEPGGRYSASGERAG